MKNKYLLGIISLILSATLFSCEENSTDNAVIPNQVGEWVGKYTSEDFIGDISISKNTEHELTLTLNTDGTGIYLDNNTLSESLMEWQLLDGPNGNPSIDIITQASSFLPFHNIQNYEITTDSKEEQVWSYTSYSTLNDSSTKYAFELTKK